MILYKYVYIYDIVGKYLLDKINLKLIKYMCILKCVYGYIKKQNHLLYTILLNHITS